MGERTFRRLSRLERSQDKMRAIFLVLSAISIAAGLILAILVFFYLLRFTFNPKDLDVLVTDWASLLVTATRQSNGEILDPQEGPARWFAIAALLTLGFLISRIPLLLIQMGTSLFHASQDYQRQTKAILREVLLELRDPDNQEAAEQQTPALSSPSNPPESNQATTELGDH